MAPTCKEGTAYMSYSAIHIIPYFYLSLQPGVAFTKIYGLAYFMVRSTTYEILITTGDLGLGQGIESKKSIKSIFRKIEKNDFFQPIFSIRKIDLKM